MRPSVFIAPAVATLVGFAGTLVLVIAAANAVGASPAQTSSWVASLCIATALASLTLSWRLRMPIICAWSTPGAALIAASHGITMEAAVGAFMLTGLLIVLTGAVKPIGNLIARIPTSVASAMLAGILVKFVLAIFEQAQAVPALVFPLLAVFLIVRLISPIWAVLSVLAAGLILSGLLGMNGAWPDGLAIAPWVFVAPRFEPTVLIGLGLPLYLVTMASQNLPGLAVLKADGYDAPARPIFILTGLLSAASALACAHTSNLAAISAAITTGPDTHPDKAERWKAGMVYGCLWVAIGLLGASSVALFASMPAALVATVAGVALIGSLTGSLSFALAHDKDRFAALMTFVVTASGLSLFGIGAAFWGLAAGLIVLALDRFAARMRHGGAR